jgi:hypothetical protein
VNSQDDAPKPIPQVVSELKDLATAYAKQETIDPLRGLGRFLGWGVGGSVMLGIGVVLMILAGLRALQTQTDATFTGSLTWLPYLITVVVGLLLMALAVWRVSRRKGPGL